MVALIAQGLPLDDPGGATEQLVSFVSRLHLGRTFTDTTLTGWLLLLGALFAGVAGGRIVSAGLRAVAARFEARGWSARAKALAGAAGPAQLAVLAAGVSLGLGAIALAPPVAAFAARVVALLYVIAIGWLAYNAVDLIELALRRVTDRSASRLDDMIVPLVRKTLRIFLIIVFALFAAENIFGADITAWLAGLGIAGLAVSLAAQDSVKNLFGSVTIFFDRPFNVGDRIVFHAYDGVIEEIGFRSFRLRTLAGHLVTIPNSDVVSGSIENISRRPNIRRVMDIAIAYDTPPAKVSEAVAIVKRLLSDPPIAAAFDLVRFPPRVAFDAFNADSLNIKVFYWFHPNDWWAYLDHCERLNLRLLEAFAEAGIEFAFPTQTLFLAGDPRRPLPPAR